MINLFFSYSHRDESLRDELEIHLSALKRQGVIATWHDRRIGAGKEFDLQISEHLEAAHIILLLVSPYFIASDYCYDIEMSRALERHKENAARVIPVILHPCDWKSLPFGKLNAVPKDGKPVSKYPNQHDAFLEVALAIREAAKEFDTAKESDTSSDSSPENQTPRAVRLPLEALSVKEQTIDSLLTYLKNDQAHSGIHLGQFGCGQRVTEEVRYQTTKETLDTKPRLYLTGWPVLILLKHRDKLPAEEMLGLAEKGVLDLFDNGWVHISMGARRYTNPVVSGRKEQIISYRHTIRAAQILLAINNSLGIPKAILGRMIDSSSDMQTKEGGWRQCNIDFRDEDLWGSAYAVGFLYTCIDKATALGLDANATNQVHKSLERTLAWLHKKWSAEAWSYGEVPTEENSTILFPEIVKAAFEYRPKLASSVLNCLETYHDPIYQPSSSYLNKTHMVGQCAATTRLAYNFFQATQFESTYGTKWIALRDYALRHIKEGYNCVEAAMLLDMLLKNIEV